MVWGGISADTKTPLVVIRGNLNAERYLNEVLAIQVVPLFQQKAVSTFQQDNARPHTARICRDYLEDNNITVLPWPARSPDLSPIEHLWDILGRRVKARQPESTETLSNALVEEWNAIPQETIKNLIYSMRSRVRHVLGANDGHTRY